MDKPISSVRSAARLLIGVAAVTLSLASTAAASGGGSIAAAPVLPLAQVVSGGGQKADFWRLQLFGGDRITFKASLPATDNWDASQFEEFSLYAPAVEDFSYANSTSVANNPENDVIGLTEFTLISPFTGLGTLAVCEGDYRDAGCSSQIYPTAPMDAYTFTATIIHATALTISTSHIARRGSTITVRATVSSPAGAPQGSCLILGRIEPLTNGHCSRRIRLGRGSRQTIPVTFTPADGWQAASGHRTIRLVL